MARETVALVYIEQSRRAKRIKALCAEVVAELQLAFERRTQLAPDKLDEHLTEVASDLIADLEKALEMPDPVLRGRCPCGSKIDHVHGCMYRGVRERWAGEAS